MFNKRQREIRHFQTIISFNNKFYREIFGTSVGFSICLITATIVLNYLLINIIALHTCFNLYIRRKNYLLSPEKDIELILNSFQSVYENLQFTLQRKDANSVPFLYTE